MNSPSHASRPWIRILVADSNQTQAELLSRALRHKPGLNVTRCSSDLSNCLDALRSVQVDVVLVNDSSNDHIHLIDILRGLRASHPRIHVILLSDKYDRNLVVDALRAGAQGLFCRASQSFRALCRCIAVVHQGQIWANSEQIGFLVEALKSGPPRTHITDAKGSLTPREDQVVRLVAEGNGNREIAQQLGVKESTVKKSLLRIYDKVGVSNRIELVLYVLTNRGKPTEAAPPQNAGQINPFGTS